ncbi:hypothetical protein L596_008273 [Steinernema carpocapsae]|uniref:Uncharacterized protein n=1 Tax=Steinernema carpocapsae TaxID=34508 RepID=A0A4V6A693_STECR|nr:hypothetical protein L596_008273 [Steinernema carpocapsae]
MSFTLQIGNTGVQPMVSLPYVHSHRVSPYDVINHESPSNSTVSRAETPIKMQFDEEIGSMNATQSVQAAIEDALGASRIDSHGAASYPQMLHAQPATHIVSPTVIRESSAILGDLVADTHRNFIRQGQVAKAQSLKQQILSLIMEFES